MRNVLVAALFILSAACGPGTRDNNPDGNNPPADACTGIECQIVNCEAQGMPPTTVSGTVFAPNGTLPLFGATVYVPLTDPGPWPEGVQCERCQSQLPGAAASSATSDVDGKFTMMNVPSGSAVPLFITIGKWRRKVVMPTITPCTDNPLPASLTSLPKNKTEGDLPKIAMGSGGCDRLECLIRKLGVSDSEFTNDAGTGSIHLYNGGGMTGAHGQTLSDYSTLTSNLDKLKQYDIVMFSCDCSRDQGVVQARMDNMKAFADIGGRAFFSHYESFWIGGNNSAAPAVWPEVAQCTIDNYPGESATGVIDQVGNPKGPAFAQWMVNVMGSTTLGQLPISGSRETCSSIDTTRAERWVHLQGGQLQNFQFTTPAEAAVGARCGKIVMSDMHVSGGGTSGSFPTACGTAGGTLSPQEKALAFMFFDIASCVGEIL